MGFGLWIMDAHENSADIRKITTRGTVVDLRTYAPRLFAHPNTRGRNFHDLLGLRGNEHQKFSGEKHGRTRPT